MKAGWCGPVLIPPFFFLFLLLGRFGAQALWDEEFDCGSYVATLPWHMAMMTGQKNRRSSRSQVLERAGENNSANRLTAYLSLL